MIIMDLTALAGVIGSIGFPAVMCLWMARHTERLEDKHSEEISELRKVVEENTIAVVKLCEKIDDHGGRYDDDGH